MTTKQSVQQRIQAMAARASAYEPEAYHFVFHALDFVLEYEDRAPCQRGQPLAPDRHVSAEQLLSGLREFAIDQYGPLARLVLERWGIYRTEDFGEIVFDLVEGGLLNKQETDRKSDFSNGFSFHDAFDFAWRAPLRHIE